MSWTLIISGTGPVPLVEARTSNSPVPPVVVPPPVLPPSPARDDTPFEWPAEPHMQQSEASARYFNLGDDPKGHLLGDFTAYYAGLAEFSNPLPGSHRFAGYRPDGMRVWAPAQGTPSSIRQVLAGGNP